MNIVNFNVGDLYTIEHDKFKEKFHTSIEYLIVRDSATDLVLEKNQTDRIPRLFDLIEIVYKNPMCKIYSKRMPKYYIFKCVR